MAGKGPKLRAGANLPKYWDNYPFPEKLTVTHWANKFGHVLDNGFSFPSPGTKITEECYWKLYDNYIEDMEAADLSEDICRGTMSFSEFQKLKK